MYEILVRICIASCIVLRYNPAMDLSSAEQFIKCKVYGRDSQNKAPEDLIQAYEQWAPTYEQDLETKLGYGAHSQAATKLCEIFPQESRCNVKILDVGAGTGFLGQQLQRHGFLHVDALDPSPKMLDEAKRRSLYKTYYCEYITGDPLDITKGTYDVVVGIGMLGVNHASFSALREMVRLTKPGGHVILVMRMRLFDVYEEYGALEPLMRQMEEEGLWRILGSDVFPNYFKDDEGIIYVYRVQ